MSYTFSVNGRVDSCNSQNHIKKSFFWLPQIVQTYEVEVYLLNPTINSNFLQEIIDECEGNMPPFNPTEPENGLTYQFTTTTQFRVGDILTLEFEYRSGKFYFIKVLRHI